jgi:hypothetical protein
VPKRPSEALNGQLACSVTADERGIRGALTVEETVVERVDQAGGTDDRALSRTAAGVEPYVSPRTQPASSHGCDDRDG